MSKSQTSPEKHTLHALLCDTYVLALKTHSAHWNVTGPSFHGLHLAFEAHYAQLTAAADILAERLRALQHAAPSGMQELLSHSSIDPAIPGTDGVLLAKTLAKDHRKIATSCQKAADNAEEAGDSATADLLVARIEEHEKTAWMLEATAS